LSQAALAKAAMALLSLLGRSSRAQWRQLVLALPVFGGGITDRVLLTCQCIFSDYLQYFCWWIKVVAVRAKIATARTVISFFFFTRVYICIVVYLLTQ
jgi:hypothetical protein